MARVELAPEVLEDLARFLEFASPDGGEAAERRIDGIVQGLGLLAEHPMIGRPVRNGRRELVIGERRSGYVALYRHMPDIDLVLVLAVRSQREARYAERERLAGIAKGARRDDPRDRKDRY